SVDGEPTVVEHIDAKGFHRHYGVELFRSERSARSLIERLADEGSEDEATPLLLEGRRLLALVNQVEMLLVGEHEVRVAGGVEELAKRLRALLGPPRRVGRGRR